MVVRDELHATTGDHVIAVTAEFQACIEDRTVSQIVQQRTLAATAALTLALTCDIYCGPEVLFETCVAMKFVDNDDETDVKREPESAEVTNTSTTVDRTFSQ